MDETARNPVDAAVVQLATADDVTAISAMVEAAYAKYIVRMGRPPAAMTVDYGALVATRTVYVLRNGGRVMGSVVLSADGDSIHVDNLVVDPAAQGRGYGRVLMEHADGMARGQGLAAVTLFTNEKMHENIALYRRIGFTETGRRTDDGFNRVYFRKDLPR